MKEDAFSKYHPAVNLVFFVGTIGFGVFLQHPLYLFAGLTASGIYYLFLNKRNGWKLIASMILLFLFISFLNPIVNTRGETILLKLFGRPYTLEALQYGFVVASIFVSMTLWFGCYNKVLTGDKFTCLFSNIMPSLSLLLVMILRMIPNLLKKANQIISVRGSIGKGIEETATRKEKMLSGVTVLSVLTSWALEGSVVTGDSMRARGYGVTKRTSFMVFRMTEADWLLTAYLFATACGTIIFSMKGNVMISFVTYFGYLLIPIILNVKEMIQWSISRYRI